MMSLNAFSKLSYGLHIIGSVHNGRSVGCVVNTLIQITSSPLKLSVTINKNNETAAAILDSGRFTAVVLGEDASMDLIGRFGFRSSLDTDKFADFPTSYDSAGIPYITQQVTARFSCRVTDTLDVGTHIIFAAEVEESEVLNDTVPPMTYLYYHTVKKGLTPPKASSYQEPEPVKKSAGWRCSVCGYIYEGEVLPDDYVCPICGQSAEVFEPL